MELTHTRLDLPAYDGVEGPPHDILRRQLAEIWIVPHSPIELDKPIDWRMHRKEEYVYIPLVPYLTSPEPDLAMAFLFQLGFRAQIDYAPHKVRRLHLVTGHPIHDIDTGQGRMWQIQLGFGFVLE